MPFANVNGKQLYYTLQPADGSQQASGLTILLVHGLGSSSSFYGPVIPRLTAAGFACLAVDTHGSCLSKYSGEKQDVKTIAQDAHSLLSSLNIATSSVIAVGHSMGGLVVSELAIVAKLAGVVLVGPVSANPLAAAAFSKRIEIVQKGGMESMADTIPTAATGSRSTATHHAFIRALLLSQPVDGYISHCNVIANATAPDFSRLSCPLLTLVGSDDKVAPAEGAKKIAASWGCDDNKKSVEILDGVGHWHCIEAGEERCDGQQPCRRCVARNAPDCIFDQAAPGPRPSRHEPVRARRDRNEPDNGPIPRPAPPAPPAAVILDTAPAATPSTSATGGTGTSSVFCGSHSAPVPRLTRLVQDGRGKYMFVGDSANLSLLQIIRRLVGDAIGSCAFIEDPLRHHVVEAAPERRENWLVEMVLRPPSKPMRSNADYFVRWYLRATNGIVNMFDEPDLHNNISQWLQSASDDQASDPSSALFFLVLAIGAQTCPEDRDDLAQRYFDYGRFLTTSGAMEEPSISTVRAYVLITMYLLGASRRNAAFMYLGIAARAAYALGIHRRDINAIFGDAEYTLRERLWKVLRMLDLFMSASLGRPPATSETRETRAEDNYSTSNDLSALLEAILTQVYSKRMVTTEVLERISQHHREWAARWHSGLAVDGTQPEETIEYEDGARAPNIGLYHLKGSYYWTIMLLSRPFLIESVSQHLSKALNHSTPEEPGGNSPSDQVLSYACVDSAIRTVDLLCGLQDHAKLPKRLPFIVNCLFVSALVLGLSQIGDLDSAFPLEKSLASAQKLLTLFSSHDPVAKRNLSIVENLQAACEVYVEKRARRKMERQSMLISGLFGSVHAGAPAGQPLQHRVYHSGFSTTQTADIGAVAETYPANATIPIGPGRQQPDGLGGEGLQMIPELAAITDMILPMSPRTVMFDSFDKTVSLFSMTDASFFELDNDTIENSLVLGNLD
ncbi:hypothetical protein GQ53DRAFT_713136 [Thozetella sp. PMI_491]|nr:hypothetical protein GQ53DRAFT_713136 [Thozetella sp. PMI_491]